MNTYHQNQLNWRVIVPILLGLAVMLVTRSSATRTPGVMAFVAALLAVAPPRLSTSGIAVLSRRLQCGFGLGLIRQGGIRCAEAACNKWYRGWGIRLTPRGWLRNVAGLVGVEIVLSEGTIFRIGTNNPIGLPEAIHANQKHANRPA